MEAVREAWTDKRLDDLQQSMGQGFGRVDSDIRDLRGEMNARFDSVDVRFRDLHSEMNARFDALQRTLLQVGGGIVATFGAALIGLIATQL